MTRDRGHYGPLDRDRHWAIGWGADRAVDYARDRTVGAAIRPLLPAVNLAGRASRAGEQLWSGTQLMGDRGEAAKPLSVVGQELFHGIGDRNRAIAMISTGFQALANDLAVWQTANKGLPTATATAQWLSADVTPMIEEWFRFSTSGSWWRKTATSWDTFETWMERLRHLRSLARAHGIVLQSSEPSPLPKTVFQRSEEGNGSEGAAMLGVLKIGAAAVLTVMGVVGVYTVVRDLRLKREQRAYHEALREIAREELHMK